MISKLIFAGYTGSKNQVWTWQKIEFVLKLISFRVCNKLPNRHFKNQACLCYNFTITYEIFGQNPNKRSSEYSNLGFSIACTLKIPTSQLSNNESTARNISGQFYFSSQKMLIWWEKYRVRRRAVGRSENSEGGLKQNSCS